MNRFSFFFVGLALFLALLTLGQAYWTIPDLKDFNSCFKTSMNQVELCSANKNYVSLKGVNPNFINALVITEDAAFFGHTGFDWNEIFNSFKQNLKRGRFFRGGSTITQQLVKNLYLSNRKSLLRKFREAVLAKRLEKKMSKQQILELYVNVIEFGPQLFGIKAASQYYFKKPPSQLNVLEAAYLVHLLPNPKVYSKTFEKKQLTPFSSGRVKTIARKLRLYKRITESQLIAAKQIVSQFPWFNLRAEQIARLQGAPLPVVFDQPLPQLSTSERAELDDLESEKSVIEPPQQEPRSTNDCFNTDENGDCLDDLPNEPADSLPNQDEANPIDSMDDPEDSQAENVSSDEELSEGGVWDESEDSFSEDSQ